MSISKKEKKERWREKGRKEGREEEAKKYIIHNILE